MAGARINFVVVNTCLCTAGALAAAALLLRMELHPRGSGSVQESWLFYNLPYVVLTAAGVIARRHPQFLESLLVFSGLSAAMVTLACYWDVESSLFVWNERMAGRHSMNCGPPWSLLALPLAYGISIIMGIASIVLRIFSSAK